MAIKLREVKISHACWKVGWCPFLYPERQASEDVDGRLGKLEEIDDMNSRARASFCEGVADEGDKLLGAKRFNDLVEKGGLRIFDKISANPDSETGGAPIKGRTLIAFMKLGQGIPYEIVRNQEIQTEITRRLGRPIERHEPGCQCADCGKQRAAVEAARKRVYRALKLRQELGYPTRPMSAELWRFCQRIKEVSNRDLASAK